MMLPSIVPARVSGSFVGVHDTAYANSRVARPLSCLSVDMLLCGNVEYVVDLFQDLVACLQETGYLSGMDPESSVNDFKSFVVELRERSVDSAQIPDVFAYLEASEVYQYRSHVKRVVRLLRVIVCPTPSAMPAVDISTSGIGLPVSVIGLVLVQCRLSSFIASSCRMIC